MKTIDAGAAATKPKKSVALSGVTAGNTALCTVGRTGNDLHYRGYDILDMAQHAEFEEIAYLLVHGKLPTRVELDAYHRKLASMRGIPAPVKVTLEQIPASANFRYIARSVIASGKIMSAPASTQARARSIAASSPSTASASVRAMMTNDESVRASTAALTRSTISAFATTSLPGL